MGFSRMSVESSHVASAERIVGVLTSLVHNDDTNLTLFLNELNSTPLESERALHHLVGVINVLLGIIEDELEVPSDELLIQLAPSIQKAALILDETLRSE